MPIVSVENAIPGYISYKSPLTFSFSRPDKKTSKNENLDYGAVNLTRIYNDATKIDRITLVIKNHFDAQDILKETANRLLENELINEEECQALHSLNVSSGTIGLRERDGVLLEVVIKNNETVIYTFEGENLDALRNRLVFWLDGVSVEKRNKSKL